MLGCQPVKIAECCIVTCVGSVTTTTAMSEYKPKKTQIHASQNHGMQSITVDT